MAIDENNKDATAILNVRLIVIALITSYEGASQKT
jgi:hypothetical protein